MKTILVMSDTHGNVRLFDEKIDTQLKEVDYIFHLGDYCTDASYLKRKYGAEKVINVLGNCDGDTVGDYKIVQVEDVKFYLCHGHSFKVKRDLNDLYLEGLDKNVDVCLFGHTHEKCEERFSNLLLLNPGNLSRYSYNSYLYIVVNKDKYVCKFVEIR
ncbi:MAG: YfcE family phosphodiesterase [Clostridia bacterium]|nr:YfcE family phosphodiesterase [Clostridia bacterium]